MTNKTIWKFPLQVADRQAVAMPKGAQILTAQMQAEQLCVWALVDPTAEMTPRTIAVIGTGHPANEVGLLYISTVQIHGGSLIFHLFEVV